MTPRSLPLLLALLGLATAACGAAPPVKPWQRGHLTKRAMKFELGQSEVLVRQHLFSSREAADGGYGQVGGGCGCN